MLLLVVIVVANLYFPNHLMDPAIRHQHYVQLTKFCKYLKVNFEIGGRRKKLTHQPEVPTNPYLNWLSIKLILMLCLVHVRNLYYHCRHLYPLLVVVSIDSILIDLLIDCLDHLGSHLVDPFEGNNGEKKC